MTIDEALKVPLPPTMRTWTAREAQAYNILRQAASVLAKPLNQRTIYAGTKVVFEVPGPGTYLVIPVSDGGSET